MTADPKATASPLTDAEIEKQIHEVEIDLTYWRAAGGGSSVTLGEATLPMLRELLSARQREQKLHEIYGFALQEVNSIKQGDAEFWQGWSQALYRVIERWDSVLLDESK